MKMNNFTIFKGIEALIRDLELERTEKRCRIIQYSNVCNVDSAHSSRKFPKSETLDCWKCFTQCFERNPNRCCKWKYELAKILLESCINKEQFKIGGSFCNFILYYLIIAREKYYNDLVAKWTLSNFLAFC